jgi:hypothetical protein
VSALDTNIDDLYQQPLDAFTAARNALAKSLTGADAQRVRTLAKPTVVPWAVNQVYWRARSTYDRLLRSGERLRKAQIAALEGRSSDVRAASEAHRRAITDAVAQAQRIASAAGSQPGPDALMRTFEAISLAPEPLDAPGRLTQPLQPAGFEALAGITPKPDRSDHDRKRGPVGRETARSAPLPRGENAGADRKRQRAAAEAARRHDAHLKKAEGAVMRAEAEEQQARTVWERSHDELLRARQMLSDLKRSPDRSS